MAGNPLASLPGLPQRPSPVRSSASETRLTQPGIEGARSRKLNPAPTAAFRIKGPNDFACRSDSPSARRGLGEPSDAGRIPAEDLNASTINDVLTPEQVKAA